MQVTRRDYKVLENRGMNYLENNNRKFQINNVFMFSGTKSFCR